ncbi:sugar efflux transporter [Streptomyces alboniger]
MDNHPPVCYVAALEAISPSQQRKECIVYKRLSPLALATFAVGTDGFVIAGLLPSIAEDLNVSVPTAGQLVTTFALTLAIAAPVFGWATSSMDRRKALMITLAVFAIGNVATALGTSYAAVMTARVITAAGVDHHLHRLQRGYRGQPARTPR